MTIPRAKSATNRHASPTGAGKPALSEAFRRAQHHSRRVRFLKFALPASAIVMVAGFFAVSWVASSLPVSVDITSTAFSDGKLVMANPKLDGFTKDERPYSLTAERAIQDIGATGVIALEKIAAKLPVDAREWAHVDAPSGTYDRDKNTLDINSDITVTTTDGMVAKLKSAFLDIEKGDIRTSDPVDIALNGAQIVADSMTILENGKILIFEKRVRMDIAPERLKTDRATTGGTNGG